jgi:ubiquinone/menaquinone biosynthesis C-methylase UbiE
MQSVLENNPCLGGPVTFSATRLLPQPTNLEDYDNKVAFAAMFPYLSQGTTVLDLGCGPFADLASSIIDQGCIYTAVDREAEFINQMKYKLSKLYTPDQFTLFEVIFLMG